MQTNPDLNVCIHIYREGGSGYLPEKKLPMRGLTRFIAAVVTIYRRGGDDLPQRFPLRKKRFTAALPMGCGAAIGSFFPGRYPDPPSLYRF